MLAYTDSCTNAVSGRHPFSGGALEQVRSRIGRQRLSAGVPAASAAPTAVAAFASALAELSGNA